MKKKTYRCLIIDQDPASGAQMLGHVESLFASAQVQSLTADALSDCQNLRPDVIFLNLTIGQRPQGFEFLEKAITTLEPRPYVFAYLDRIESEIVAHAIENGVADVFARPYDEDIIATKINRFLKSENTVERDISYTKLNPPMKGKVELRLKLLEVDENGLTFSCNHYISKGAKFDLSAPLTQEIWDQASMPMMVTKTWPGETYSEYLIFVEPKDANEASSGALRRYILSKL